MDIEKLLNSTAAGQIARKLDAKDGTQDNQISKDIWNQFIDEIGTGKKLQHSTSIFVGDAMRSITTYLVRESRTQNKDINVLVDTWQPKTADGKEIKANKATLTPAQKSAAPAKKAAPAASKAKAADPAKEAAKKAEQEKLRAEKIAEDEASVKVTVPKEVAIKIMPIDEAKLKKINKFRAEGKKVATEIKNANDTYLNNTDFLGLRKEKNIGKIELSLGKITKDNVLYVLNEIPNLADVIDGVDYMGDGLDVSDVKKYVLEPLIAKAKEAGLTKISLQEKNKNGKLETNEYKLEEYLKAAEDRGIDFAKKVIDEVRRILNANDKKTFSTYNNSVKAYNEKAKKANEYNRTTRVKAQQIIDAANKFMAEVANAETKPTITSVHNDEKNYDWKQVELSDGRWISVHCNSDKEITRISISYNTTQTTKNGVKDDYSEVIYNADKTYVADPETGKHVTEISSGYDFEKLKALAKKIFG